ENEMLGEIPRNNENPILRVTNLTQEEDWRIANVVPIFKKGSKSEPGNYRPELDEEAIDSVVKYASFKNMKQNNMTNYSLVPSGYMDQEKSPFFRKGIVGDWKNNFTVAQNEYFDKIYKAEMQDFSVKFPWDSNVPE
ncbi:unnamed protein product, partial [Ranitomeya imitator]